MLSRRAKPHTDRVYFHSEHEFGRPARIGIALHFIPASVELCVTLLACINHIAFLAYKNYERTGKQRDGEEAEPHSLRLASCAVKLLLEALFLSSRLRVTSALA